MSVCVWGVCLREQVKKRKRKKKKRKYRQKSRQEAWTDSKGCYIILCWDADWPFIMCQSEKKRREGWGSTPPHPPTHLLFNKPDDKALSTHKVTSPL